MEYNEREVIEETLYRYRSDLLTPIEHELGLAFLARAKGSIYKAPHVEERMRFSMGNLADSRVDAVLENGFLEFRRTVVDRILREHSAEISFNRCPACHRIVGTPQAKWCKWCKHDWH